MNLFTKAASLSARLSMRPCIFILLIALKTYPWVLQAEAIRDDQNLFELSSRKCSVAKDSLELEGEVVLKTPFGTVRADRAKVRGAADSLQEDGAVDLEGSVSLLSFDGSREIRCGSASFSAETGKGVCRGGDRQVLFLQGEKLEDKLTMSADVLYFTYEKAKDGQPARGLSMVRAEGNVEIRLPGDAVAKGDVIETAADPMGSNERSIHLYSSGKPCTITLAETLFLKAGKVVFREQEGTLQLYEPEGEAHIADMQVNFTSDFLTWFPKNKRLLLEGNTRLSSGTMVWTVEGVLAADIKDSFVKPPLLAKSRQGRMEAALPLGIPFQKIGKGQQIEIMAQGKMALNGIGRGMMIDCQGKAVYSSENSLLVLDREGAGNKVHLLDKFGEVFSDRAVVAFSKAGSVSEIEKIELFGGVGIVNRMFAPDLSETSQFLLADEATIEPKTDSVSLRAKKGKRVLIMDRVNRVQVSAETVRVKRNREGHPFSIKGGGDVRFAFKEEELKEIKKRFKLDRSGSENE